MIWKKRKNYWNLHDKKNEKIEKKCFFFKYLKDAKDPQEKHAKFCVSEINL